MAPRTSFAAPLSLLLAFGVAGAGAVMNVRTASLRTAPLRGMRPSSKPAHAHQPTNVEKAPLMASLATQLGDFGVSFIQQEAVLLSSPAPSTAASTPTITEVEKSDAQSLGGTPAPTPAPSASLMQEVQEVARELPVNSPQLSSGGTMTTPIVVALVGVLAVGVLSAALRMIMPQSSASTCKKEGAHLPVVEVEAPLEELKDELHSTTSKDAAVALVNVVPLPSAHADPSAEEASGAKSPAIACSSPTGTGAGEQLLVQAVGALPVFSGDDIMPPRARYDCILVQPQEDMISVRLEGYVQAPRGGGSFAPLAGRECALFSTSVAEPRLDGVQAPPVSFHSVNLDFELELVARRETEEASLTSSPATRIHIRASQVALFGMVSGKQYQQARLCDVSEEVQSFVRAHRVGARTLGDHTVFEFTESCLHVGALVTCMGKLRRLTSGELELLPCDFQGFGDGSGVCTPLQAEKVLITDHPSLLNGCAAP